MNWQVSNGDRDMFIFSVVLVAPFNKLKWTGIPGWSPKRELAGFERGQGHVYFLCSADHEQEWQPYPVDPYSAVFDDDHH